MSNRICQSLFVASLSALILSHVAQGQVADKTAGEAVLKEPGKNGDDLLPNIFGKPTPQQLSEDEIRQHLGTLLSWEGSKAYYYYFISMPKYIDTTANYAVDFNKMIGQNIRQHPYGIGSGEGDPGITLTVPIEMKVLSNNYGMCVVLDGLNAPVPVRAADEFTANFLNGFVTRIVVGAYVRALNSKGADISLQRLNFANRISREDLIPIPQDFIWATSYFVPLIPHDAKPGQFIVPGGPKEAFQWGLDRLMRTNSLHAAGILWGWRAASELDSLRY